MDIILPMMEPSNFMEERFMPARVIQNNGGNKGKAQAPKVQPKAPVVSEKEQDKIKKEMEAVLAESVQNASKNSSQSAPSASNVQNPLASSMDRVNFYAGHDRLNLQGTCVQRVRDLQEENDHLQREITAKEEELVNCTDPLAILADIEHRKIIIARNTGEILKIYLRNEERLKRIKELESHNSRIQKEMMEMQGRFISTKDMEEKTKFASEFFILKAEIEKNLQEISDLNKK